MRTACPPLVDPFDLFWVVLVSSPFRVVVVGSGFAGTATAVNLLRAWPGGPLELSLLERDGDVGPGVAYATPDRRHLLDVTAGGMTALRDEPEHFLTWLDLRAGTLQRLEPAAGGRIAVTYRAGARSAGSATAGGEAVERIEVDAVVNCTGPDPAPGADGDPLLSALIEDRLGRAGPLGLGLETGPDGELCDCDGRPSSRLFTLGALRRGQLWETAAVPEIRCQAADLGRLLAARGAAQVAAARAAPAADAA